MQVSRGHWYAVVSSRELRDRPLGKTRFGERLVFWRDAGGRPVCLEDRCAHRGAALSLGRVRAGQIACSFHGLCYDASGRCVKVPVEGSWNIPETLRVAAYPVAEGNGMVWLWRGPALEESELPPPPRFPSVEGLTHGEMTWTWNGHYSRCIEGVIDFSHLPFVHARTLGLMIRNPECSVTVELVDGGFRAHLESDSLKRQFIEFVYPNVWLNCVGPKYILAAIFAPVDDTHTEAYLRWYYPAALRWLHPFVNVFGRFMQWLVFKDDQPILASQRPVNVDDADTDRLLPSDAPHVAYRRLRRLHERERRRELSA
jgi:phenylpropionate dioxygenase-like ring-hydroxylating dioxygenase large terminal subunit